MKYWTDTIYVGLGSGAHGMTGRNRYSNVADPARYEAAVTKGALPHETFTKLTPMVRFKDALIMGLRLVDGVDLRLLGERYHIDAKAFVDGTVEDLHKAGLLAFSWNRVTLTDRGETTLQPCLLPVGVNVTRTERQHAGPFRDVTIR